MARQVTEAQPDAEHPDVFLCHSSPDKLLVHEVAVALQGRGLRVWLDEWKLQPGRPWQEEIERAVHAAKSGAIFIGPGGIGPWAEREMRAFLSMFAKRGISVIPVLLPGASQDLPLFLKEFTWVDLRGGLSASDLERLVWGITGERSPPSAASGVQKPGPGRRWWNRRTILGAALGGLLATGALALWLKYAAHSVPETDTQSLKPALLPAPAYGMRAAADLGDSAEFASLSPSGKLLAYGDRRTSFILNLETGLHQRLLPDAKEQVFCVAWIRDDRWVIVASGSLSSGNYLLHLIDVSTGRDEPLWHVEECPAVASDGRSIAYWKKGDDRRSSLMVRDIEPDVLPKVQQSTERSVPGIGGVKTELAWSPDRKWVTVCRSHRYGAGRYQQRLTAIRVDNGKQELLLQDEHLDCGGVAWLPGWRIVYFRKAEIGPPGDWRATGALWSLDLDPQTLAPVQAPQLFQQLPAGTVMSLGVDASGERIGVELGHVEPRAQWAALDEERGLAAPLRQITADGSETVEDWLDDDTLILSTGDFGNPAAIFKSVSSGSVRRALAPGSRSPRVFNNDQLIHFRWRDAKSRRGDFIRTDSTGALESIVAEALIPDVEVAGVNPAVAPRVNPFLRCARSAPRCAWAPIGAEGSDLLPLNVNTGAQGIVPGLDVDAFYATSIAISRDGSLAAAGRGENIDPWVRFFELKDVQWGDGHERDLREDSLVGKVSLPIECDANLLAFTPDSAGVYASATCRSDPLHRLFFVGRDGFVKQVDSRQSGRYAAVAVSPDGKKLAVSIARYKIVLWLVDAVNGVWPESRVAPSVTDHVKWRDRKIRCPKNDGSETCGDCCFPGDIITPYPDCRCTFDGEKRDRDRGIQP